MDGGDKKKVDQDDKARIMSTQAKKPENEGQTKKGSFPSRIQKAADTNENQWTCFSYLPVILTMCRWLKLKSYSFETGYQLHQDVCRKCMKTIATTPSNIFMYHNGILAFFVDCFRIL